MKKLRILSLVLILLGLSEKILAQTEYKIVEIPQRSSIPFTFQTNSIIEQYLKYYQGRGRLVMEMELHRSGTHQKMISRIFTEESLPDDLFWIGQVEAMWGHWWDWNSPRPLWIFPSDIAPKFGLRKTKFVDETRSFEKATRATAQYLKFLYYKYDNNWELALAAYFAGENAVTRAIKKAKVKDYWKIYKYLPAETRNFVPDVLATILIARDKQKYGFGNVLSAPPLEYELVRIPPSISLKMIAEFADEKIEYIKYLNQELISNETPPEPYVVRVPKGKGESFAKRIRSLPSK